MKRKLQSLKKNQKKMTIMKNEKKTTKSEEKPLQKKPK